MEKLGQVEERITLTEVHHEICTAIDRFYEVSIRIPKASLEIVQHIYGRFDDALYSIYEAESTHDADEKARYLHRAKDDLYYQFTSLETLVKNHSITVGQGNEVIEALKIAHKDTSKWLTSIIHNNKKTLSR